MRSLLCPFFQMQWQVKLPHKLVRESDYACFGGVEVIALNIKALVEAWEQKDEEKEIAALKEIGKKVQML